MNAPTANPALAASACSAGVMALYRTSGPRIKDHRVVLYLDADRDWTARHFARNGSVSPALARSPLPPEAVKYIRTKHRAASLRYSGTPPANIEGLAADLELLGADSATVARFVAAATPYLSPNAPASATGQEGEQ